MNYQEKNPKTKQLYWLATLKAQASRVLPNYQVLLMSKNYIQERTFTILES